ncbi:MAG: hypothetical protein DRN04_19080 [Thermoprotei archaeon]|nr:MAG: hypothetical protein DRN04_19080 [Thermoprotei archaeon]RLF18046.1 MAG: hypothetical protein DRZ82_08960 [Thermoprotei archaeon]
MGFLGIREIIERIDKNTEAIKNLQEQVRSLQEQVLENSKATRGLQEQIVKLQEQVVKLQEQTRNLQEQVLKHSKRLEEHSKAIRSLQEEIKRLGDKISALGARWDLIAEEVFRNALAKFVQDYFKIAKVKRWTYFDKDGKVFGYPTLIEIDIIVKDNIHRLIEVKSSVDPYDIWAFNRKCNFYKELNKVNVRKIIVTCYAEDRAKETAKALGVEIIER